MSEQEILYFFMTTSQGTSSQPLQVEGRLAIQVFLSWDLSYWSDTLNYCPLIGRDWAERGELELSYYGLRYVKYLLV